MQGHIEVVRALLTSGANPNVRLEGIDDTTALHIASTVGNIEIVRLLLDAKADPNVSSRSGITPLMAAAGSGHEVVADALRAAGAR